MSRSLRTLSALTRPSNFVRPLTRSQHTLLRQNGNFKIQPVRIKSNLPRQAKRSFYQITIGLIVCYYALGIVDIEVVEVGDKSGDNADNGAQEDDKVDEDDVHVPETMPEDAFFIPLGLVRQRPLTLYNVSDPEWQSFVKFSKDRKRHPAIRKELADMVYQGLMGSKELQREIGVPIELGRQWLDFSIPHGPAPEYERSGLEIADDYIAWTTRPVSALQVARLNSALVPIPVAKSMWASYSVYCSLQLARLKNLLNIATPSSNTSPQLPVGGITVKQLTENGSKQETQTRAQMDKMSDPKSDGSSTKGSAKSAASSGGSNVYGSLPSLPQPDSDIGPAVKEFKRTWANNWRPPGSYGERGTFIVRGLIELKGPKGSCILETMADYHPRDGKYMSLQAFVKYIIPRRQGPPRRVPELK